MPTILRKHIEQWIATPLSAPAMQPGPHALGDAPADVLYAVRELPGAGLLLAAPANGQPPRWALIVADPVQVLHNGQPVRAGLRLLAHGDALAVEGHEPVFFSTEEPARVEPFVGPAPVTCPRCRDTIAAGQAAVRCPACGVVHHQSGERNCWTYAERCALCAQPTALDAGLQWTPEGL